MKASKPILFIDGYCILCNRLALWIQKKLKSDSIHIASLQDEKLISELGLHLPKDINSLIWVPIHGDPLVKSDAVIALSQHLKGPYRQLGNSIKVFPKKLRDWGYAIVAKHRYKWFGKKEVCELPDPNSDLFLRA